MSDIYDLCWSPDAQYILSGSSIDNSARIWDTATSMDCNAAILYSLVDGRETCSNTVGPCAFRSGGGLGSQGTVSCHAE